MVREVPMRNRKGIVRAVALVDDEDFASVQKYPWCVKVTTHTMYARTNVPSETTASGHTTLFMHKMLTGWDLTDHIDGNGLNNCRSNLREATTQQNHRNRHVTRGVSRFKGVNWDPGRGQWRANITVLRRTIFLGRFAAEEEAALAYNAAALERFGEFALLNEIE